MVNDWSACQAIHATVALPAHHDIRADVALPPLVGGPVAPPAVEDSVAVAVLPVDGSDIPPVNDSDVSTVALPPVGAVEEYSSNDDNTQAHDNETEDNYELKHGEDASME